MEKSRANKRTKRGSFVLLQKHFCTGTDNLAAPQNYLCAHEKNFSINSTSFLFEAWFLPLTTLIEICSVDDCLVLDKTHSHTKLQLQHKSHNYNSAVNPWSLILVCSTRSNLIIFNFITFQVMQLCLFQAWPQCSVIYIIFITSVLITSENFLYLNI